MPVYLPGLRDLLRRLACWLGRHAFHKSRAIQFESNPGEIYEVWACGVPGCDVRKIKVFEDPG